MSLRYTVFKGWKGLGLAAEPNTGNNGVHASASPFGALAERANWLGMPWESDIRSSDAGFRVPLTTIKTWCDEPAVPFQGKAQSLFDLVEDLDSRDCLRKSASINARFSSDVPERRFAQAGVFARGVRGWSCVHDARLRQWWVDWAHHCFFSRVSCHCWGSSQPRGTMTWQWWRGET